MAYLIPVCPNAPRRRNHQSNILLRPLFHVSGIPHQVYELRAFVHDLVYVQTDLLPHFLRTVAVPEHVACCFLRNYHTDVIFHLVSSQMLSGVIFRRKKVGFRGQDVSACSPRETPDFIRDPQLPSELPELFHACSI